MANGTYNIRFKEGADGTKPVAYYVDTPKGGDGLPGKAIVHEVKVMANFYPTPGTINEMYYILSDGRKINDKALYATENEAGKEAQRVNEMMHEAANGNKKALKAPKE